MSDDYEASESYYADDVNISSGSIKKGIGVGILVTLVFELFVSFVLDAQGNLVHRYIAYMLGIAALFAASIYAKSTWKMFFLGTPVIVAVSFILPLADPSLFAGLMSPFINLLPTLNAISDSLDKSGQDVSDYEEILDLLNTYGIILDFVLAIIVGTIAALGLVGFVKIFSNKPGILTIISFTFSLIFFIVGVIILPYILVVATGVSQFTLSLGAGGVNLSAGFQIVNEGGELSDANEFFNEAEKWFNEADDMLQGLEDLLVFQLLGTAAPDYKVLVDNFLIVIDSAVDLAKGIGPMFIGINTLQEGMTQSMGVVDASVASTRLQLAALTPEEEAEFEAGIALIKQGFGNISRAIPNIQNALENFQKVNREKTLAAADAEGIDVEEQLDLIEGTVNLINSALDIFELFITPAEDPNPNDDFTVEEPLVHLIRGVVRLTDASDTIGRTSNFKGTGPTFEKVVDHLSITVATFDDPFFAAFDNADVKGVSDLVDLKLELSGMFDFIKDGGNVAIAMGEFGSIAAPTLTKMNSTMKILKSTSDFAAISDNEYDLALANFTGSGGIINGSKQMATEGEDVDSAVLNVQTRSTNDEYGLLSNVAADFVDVFSDFEMGLNGRNFQYISQGFYNILRTAKELKVVDAEVNNINTEKDFLNSIDQADYGANVAEINTAVTNINNSVIVIQDSIISVNVTLVYASGNFSLVGDSMPQLADTANAISGPGGISENLLDISNAINAIYLQTEQLPQTDVEFINKTTEITAQVSVIQSSLTNINGNLANVDIES